MKPRVAAQPDLGRSLRGVDGTNPRGMSRRSGSGPAPARHLPDSPPGRGADRDDLRSGRGLHSAGSQHPQTHQEAHYSLGVQGAGRLSESPHVWIKSSASVIELWMWW